MRHIFRKFSPHSYFIFIKVQVSVRVVNERQTHIHTTESCIAAKYTTTMIIIIKFACCFSDIHTHTRTYTPAGVCLAVTQFPGREIFVDQWS